MAELRDHPYRQVERGAPGTLGWKIHYYSELDSTQQVAARLAAAGEAAGVTVIAESQTAGRGRMGHLWFSPPGVNLYLTVVLRPALAAERVPLLSLVGGVAVAEALDEHAPKLPRLKWPNDVWFGERKAGGILAEAAPSGSGGPVVLLGIGLNLNLPADRLPAELAATATSLLIETGRPCDRAALLASLLSRLASRLAQIESAGFEPIAPLWEHYSLMTDRQVTVRDASRTISGRAIGIDKQGALLVMTERGTERVIAGEVRIEAFGR